MTALLCAMSGVREEATWRGRDVQRRAARHRRRLRHGLRRHRRRHCRDASPRDRATLRTATRRRRSGTPPARPSGVARGEARGRDADDRLREPHLQVLRVLSTGQRLARNRN